MIIRCPECNKLLFKIKLNGYLRYEIKCPKCNKVVVTSLERNEYNIKNYRRRFGVRPWRRE